MVYAVDRTVEFDSLYPCSQNYGPKTTVPVRKERHFLLIVKSLIDGMDDLHVYFKSNSKAYVDSYDDHFKTSFEDTCELIIRKCQNILEEATNELQKTEDSTQLLQHFTGISEILRKRLLKISADYTSLKALKYKNESLVKFTIDTKKMDKFPALRQADRPQPNQKVFNEPEPTDGNIDSGMIQDPEYELELENRQLLQQLIHEDIETLELEKKLDELNEMQQLLSQKVYDQSESICRIYETTVTSRGLIQQGNTYFDQAITNISSYRNSLIFILLSMIISLLFLDWYGR